MSKFQINDICKIIDIYDFTGFSHPNPPPWDEWKLGLIVRITKNWGSDYAVEVPRELNPQCYNEKGEWDYLNAWCSTKCFGWSWVQERNLKLVEKYSFDEELSEEKIKKIIEKANKINVVEISSETKNFFAPIKGGEGSPVIMTIAYKEKDKDKKIFQL